MKLKTALLCFVFYFSITFALNAQTFTSSNLPIIFINTSDGASIVDNPRIFAQMTILDNGAGKRNLVSDLSNLQSIKYSGTISIETRGSTSQLTDKKPYGLTTLKADKVTPADVSLLSLPADNDWILNAMSFEPSMMRDFISYELSRRIGHYATHTIYCELMINNEYKGLYILQEKIKRGENRVDLSSMTATDNSPTSISGGYIVKVDKLSAGETANWIESSRGGQYDLNYIISYPKPEKISPEQKIYIKSVFDKLSEQAKFGNTSIINGFPSVIDIPSFVDFMLINELAANVDAYQYSTYFHKDKGAKLCAGPIWDFNLTYGNDLFFWGYDRSKYDKWQFSNGDNEGSVFWRNLFNNNLFKCLLAKRWNELTQENKPLNKGEIEKLIDNTAILIKESVERESIRWGKEIDFGYEINKLKTFINSRMNWMTGSLGSYSSCSSPFIPKLVITKIMYQPATNNDFNNSEQQEFIEITNNSPTTINLTGVYLSGNSLSYLFPSLTSIAANERIFLANDLTTFNLKYKKTAFGQFSRNLSNNSETLKLQDALGNLIDEVSYSNTSPWPIANGNGNFIELSNLDSNNNLAENWRTNLVLSAEEIANHSKISISPNPCENNIHISSLDDNSQIQIYNSKGGLIGTWKNLSSILDIDVSNFNIGLYIISIRSKNTITNYKIVKGE